MAKQVLYLLLPKAEENARSRRSVSQSAKITSAPTPVITSISCLKWMSPLSGMSEGIDWLEVSQLRREKPIYELGHCCHRSMCHEAVISNPSLLMLISLLASLLSSNSSHFSNQQLFSPMLSLLSFKCCKSLLTLSRSSFSFQLTVR